MRLRGCWEWQELSWLQSHCRGLGCTARVYRGGLPVTAAASLCSHWHYQAQHYLLGCLFNDKASSPTQKENGGAPPVGLQALGQGHCWISVLFPSQLPHKAKCTGVGGRWGRSRGRKRTVASAQGLWQVSSISQIPAQSSCPCPPWLPSRSPELRFFVVHTLSDGLPA